ncbi:MAG TPA: hypothetical protein VF678_07600 [bacterium]
MRSPTSYSTTDILHWLDQAKVLLEQTLSRIQVDAPALSTEDRQMVASNLVLIANVVTHLSQHVLRAEPEGANPTEPVALAKHPGVLERLRAIHDKMQVVYQRLQSGVAPLN